MIIRELDKYFDSILPKELSCNWDNDGLMLCADSKREVKKALLTLDVTDEAIDRAIEIGADTIFTHHPFIFNPIASITEKNGRVKLIIKILRHGISVFSYHTRLDAIDGGVNSILASAVGMKNIRKLNEQNPPLCRIGEVDPISVESFATRVKNVLNAPSVYLAKTSNCPAIVKRVAVLGGACDKEFVHTAINAGADVLLTGDASYNLVLDANIDGISVICAGHYATENPVLSFFEEKLKLFGVETVRYDCGYFTYL